MISMTSKTKHDRLICKILDYVAHTLAELKNWNCKNSLGQGTSLTLSIANPFNFFFSSKIVREAEKLQVLSSY